MADPEDGRMTSEHVDEGTVHAWLDGQLAAADAARLESHIAACAACAAVVAEARGFVAASSRILSGLDGVPAQVVPRVRSRARIWQVRAAAAVVVVALGAAAVLRDTGRLGPVRQAASAPQPSAAASPASGLPDTTQVPSVSATPAPSPVLAAPRAPVPAVPPEKKQTPMVRPGRAAAENAMQQSRAGAPPSSTAQTAGTGAAAAPQAGRQDSSAHAPFTASRAAFAAKAMPRAAQDGALEQTYDSSAGSHVSTLLNARRIASGAYRECAGKVVTLPIGDSEASPPTSVTTVRLDSATRPSPARAFVVTVPGGEVPVNGWWRPAGADSAVVSLVNHNVSPALAVGADSAATGTPAAPPASTARIRCPSP